MQHAIQIDPSMAAGAQRESTPFTRCRFNPCIAHHLFAQDSLASLNASAGAAFRPAGSRPPGYEFEMSPEHSTIPFRNLKTDLRVGKVPVPPPPPGPATGTMGMIAVSHAWLILARANEQEVNAKRTF